MATYKNVSNSQTRVIRADGSSDIVPQGGTTQFSDPPSPHEDQLIRANQFELVEASPAKPKRKLFANAATDNQTEAESDS